MKYQYKIGDRVLLKNDFGASMAHFGGKGCEALIAGTYASKYGNGENGDQTHFTLLIFDGLKEPYRSSWYSSKNFERLIEKKNDKSLLYLMKYKIKNG